MIIKCDILVVGGGGAGLRAAIAARNGDPDLKVVLATKGKLGKSGVTAVACSDRMAYHATLPDTAPGGADNWFYHAKDIFEIGGRVSDAHLATVLAKNAAESYLYLESLGVPFVKKAGKTHQFITDGSDYPRACYTGPKTAVHIEEALIKEFIRQDIEALNYSQLFHIFTDNNQVSGALFLHPAYNDSKKEEIILIETPAIIMATGGGGEIFADNVFPAGNSGDGYSAALKAGAKLVNMEFIQLGVASLKTKLNFSGSLMRAIPKVINDKGEEILFKYFPAGYNPAAIYGQLFKKGASWPVTYEHKTHIFDIIFYKERAMGNRVFLDYASNPKEFHFNNLDKDLQLLYLDEVKEDLGEIKRFKKPVNRLREINFDSINWLKDRGIDLESGDLVEVAACAQHFQGGIKINSRGETAVSGLYAAGECAGGQHGANRPGGNALLDGQVFGKICAENALSYLRNNNGHSVSKDNLKKEINRLKRFDSVGECSADNVRRELKLIMTHCASVIRTENEVKEGLKKLQLLREKKIYRDKNRLSFAVETEAMLNVAEAVLMAVLKRDESRGPHLRFQSFSDNEPIKRRDPEWQKYLVIKGDKEGKIEVEPKQPITDYEYSD